MLPDNVMGSALISKDFKYRYTLRRKWDKYPWFEPGAPKTAVWVGCNPSTADAYLNDPTVYRIIDFTQQFGYTRFVLVNLDAFRTPSTRELRLAKDPVGPHNDVHLTKIARQATMEGSHIIACWGSRARWNRIQSVLKLPGFDKLHCLGVTRGGWPRHPLYLPRDSQLMPWSMETAGFDGPP